MDLTLAEADAIITYTGLGAVLALPNWVVVPYVMAGRSTTGRASFVVMTRDTPFNSTESD